MPDDPNETDDSPGRLRRMYEEEATARAASDGRVAELERRDAFRDAGLDLKQPLHKMAADSYKGELESEKVTEYITSLGLNQKADPPAPNTDPAEAATLERIANAGRGDGEPAATPDRIAQLKRDMEAAGRRGNIAELDRIATELAEAQGNLVIRQ